MDLQRFTQLADAYGHDLRRWPEAERSAAEALLTREPAAAAILAEVGQLDAILDRWTVMGVSPYLRASILAGAPQSRRIRARRGLGWWLSGAGFATAGAAGLLAGAALCYTSLTDVRREGMVAASVPELVAVPAADADADQV